MAVRFPVTDRAVRRRTSKLGQKQLGKFTNLKIRAMFFVICVMFLSCLVSVQCNECRCQPQKTQFDTKYTNSVNETCNKCFFFSYNYFVEQNWTARVCIRSPSPGPTPLLVVARQSVSAITFSVPHSVKGDSSEFPSVCRTLCPISNHLNTSFLNETVQTILLDFWSRSPTQFEFEVQIVNDFIIRTNEPAVLNVTVAQPVVLQYNVPSDLESVRVEANSNTSECMVLSVEDIECPFHDTHETIQQGGFRQTHTKKSAITIRKTSSFEKIYIVMLLNPKDKDCKESEDSVEINNFKEVKVEVTPVYETYMNPHVLWLPGLLIILIGMCCSCCYRCYSHVDKVEFRKWLAKSTNISETEREAEEKYRQETVLLSDMLEKKPWSSKSYGYSWTLGIVAVFYGLPAIQLVYVSQNLIRKTGNLDTCYYNYLCSNTVELGLWVINDFNHVFSNIGYILLGIIFLLIVYNRERKDPESPWNIKKRQTLHLTNRDVQSSGNENIQNEITCGDLAMLESADFISELVGCKKGIPPHYGLYYAMGWALIMEGVMSASYHICPKKSNFQFDTTFMYVISLLCIMKLFYARHQAIAPKAYSVWIMLAFSIFLPFIGMFNEVAFWILFILWALRIYIFTSSVFLVPAKLDFSLCPTCCCCLKKKLITPKSYANMLFRIAACTSALTVSTEVLIILRVYGFDFNTLILSFYIINLIIYSMFYVTMKKVLLFFISRPKSFEEKIGSASIWFLLFLSTAFFAIGYFLTNNAEWKITPAESRERNVPCYSDYNYYDAHDVWHFVSSFSIFFLYLFLLTVDDDLAEKPVTNIISF